MNVQDARAIGARARVIRRRRGLSLEVVAGLTGITKTYLSMLELGQRGFNRRGLIENLAEALGCSVADLTAQLYPAPDRATAEGEGRCPASVWRSTILAPTRCLTSHRDHSMSWGPGPTARTSIVIRVGSPSRGAIWARC